VIRALIADDEPLSRRAVQQLIARHADITVVAECADGEAAAQAILRLQPDVAFLDVRMPISSGLDVARESDPHRAPLVVFITAHDEFAIAAFDVAAIDYLTKPLVDERFDTALQRVRDRLSGRRVYTPHLVARSGTRDFIVPVEDIDYIEAEDVYASVVAQRRRRLVRAPLDLLERTLDPRLFARIHRSYIVRIDRVKEIHRDGGTLRLIVAGAALPVSRRRRTMVEAILAPLATSRRPPAT
jgi:two-component system, LytTR family, response regulator